MDLCQNFPTCNDLLTDGGVGAPEIVLFGRFSYLQLSKFSSLKSLYRIQWKFAYGFPHEIFVGIFYLKNMAVVTKKRT